MTAARESLFIGKSVERYRARQSGRSSINKDGIPLNAQPGCQPEHHVPVSNIQRRVPHREYEKARAQAAEVAKERQPLKPATRNPSRPQNRTCRLTHGHADG
jgi:hypothetical protein